MEYPYTDQVKAKAEITVDDFIMFATEGDNVLDSGTVIERDGDRIVVLFENDDRDDDIIEFDLNKITIYRDKEWEDNAQEISSSTLEDVSFEAVLAAAKVLSEQANVKADEKGDKELL